MTPTSLPSPLSETSAEATLSKLREEYLLEARQAPKLFADLARVETYIGESYNFRSLIELLQNADDAGATRFLARSVPEGLVVANDGRLFSARDLEALCRSGASTKQRGGDTIGYRGIGFKSTVQIARRIHVISGALSFYFDRQTTREQLSADYDVPLIRVPHRHDVWPPALDSHVRLAREDGHSTVFLFEDLQAGAETLFDLHMSSALFLKNLTSIQFEHSHISRRIGLNRIDRGADRVIDIVEGDNRQSWLCLGGGTNQDDVVALLVMDGRIIGATEEEALFHSFTPTREPTGAALKINGDYSTDPSRQHIRFDARSSQALESACGILSRKVLSLLAGREQLPGFFSPLAGSNSAGEARRRFIGAVKKALFTDGGPALPSARLAPAWLLQDSYERVQATRGGTVITRAMLEAYPELTGFLEELQVPKLTLKEVVESLPCEGLGEIGAAQLLVKLINQYRYDLDDTRVQWLRSLPVFATAEGLRTASELGKARKPSAGFERYVSDNVDRGDLEYFEKKLGLAGILMSTAGKRVITVVSSLPGPLVGQLEPALSPFKSQPQFKKWRTAESNATEYFASLRGVVSAKDVSESNLGYDIDVLLQSGHKYVIEVKSVQGFGEPIRMTPNEYSVAHDMGPRYLLVVVINDDPIQIKTVPDPINRLKFHKKVERFSWLCGSYLNLLEDPLTLLQGQGEKR